MNLATHVIARRLAVRHLTHAGIVVLDLDWRSPTTGATLPIVARTRDGSVLVVCHVHIRSHVLTTLAETVPPPIRWRAAAEWLAGTGMRPAMVRFDRVVVYLPRHGTARVEHTSGSRSPFPPHQTVRGPTHPGATAWHDRSSATGSE